MFLWSFCCNPRLSREGAKYLRITALIYLPHGISLVTSNVIRSVGNVKLGLIALRLDYIIKSVWLVTRLKSGKWIHPAKKMA